MRLSYKFMASRKIIGSFVRPWGLIRPGIREWQRGKIRSCRPHPLELGFEETVAGRRVVISSDGGRLRLREPKRGPQTKKGRRRYTGAWREPKVLIVYVVDAEGKQESCFAPFIDATLQGPDAVFALLRIYLQRLESTRADHVLFIAGGAPWIWKRVPLLVQALGLAPEQVHQLLDFYHAVHHLGQVATLRKDWSAKARTRWRTHQRHLHL